MPKLKSKTKPKGQQERKVLYPQFEVKLCFPGAEGPITCEEMKRYLLWEDEDSYVARFEQEHPGKKPDLESCLLKDECGKRIWAWNVCRNRPFKEEHARSLCQDILEGNWAGPTQMPGETVNGETVIVSRTGEVTSGQHRGIALILAGQKWERSPNSWRDKWPAEPVLDTLLVLGASEDPRVLRTLDNVMPRSESDVIYTSNIFAGLKPRERRECSRMLAAAIDTLWRRTQAGGSGESRTYQTHSQSLTFLDRHKRLLEAVKTIHDLNGGKGGRAISTLQLSPGSSAAMLYLMASSRSDGDSYRNGVPAPSEKQMDFDRWDEAVLWWRTLTEEKEGNPVRAAIGLLANTDGTLGGNSIEKLSTLAKAWNLHLEGGKVTEEDLRLEYQVGADNVRVLVERPNVGGIDLGEKPGRVALAEPTPEEQREIEDRRAAADRKRLAEELSNRLKVMRKGKTPASDGTSGALADQVNAIKEAHPGQLLLLKRGKEWGAWGEDAHEIGKVCKVGLKVQNGLPLAEVPAKDLPAALTKLSSAGRKAILWEQINGQAVIKEAEDWLAEQPAQPVKPASAKKLLIKKPKPAEAAASA